MDLKTFLASPHTDTLKSAIRRVAEEERGRFVDAIDRVVQTATDQINGVASCLRGLPMDALNPLLARDALIYVGVGEVADSKNLSIRGSVNGFVAECAEYGRSDVFYSMQATLGQPVDARGWNSGNRWTRKERRMRVIVALVPLPDEPEDA